jgi:hypothetical protein
MIGLMKQVVAGWEERVVEQVMVTKLEAPVIDEDCAWVGGNSKLLLESLFEIGIGEEEIEEGIAWLDDDRGGRLAEDEGEMVSKAGSMGW